MMLSLHLYKIILSLLSAIDPQMHMLINLLIHALSHHSAIMIFLISTLSNIMC
jgi:hypothetical protein